MIKDPQYWRRDMLGRARRISSRCSQARWTHVSFTRTEQDVMLGFLSVRKILEAGQMSSNVRGMHVTIGRFPKSSLTPDYPPPPPLLMIYYDLRTPERIQKSLAFLCNQIVHSYLFGIAIGHAGGLKGVYFASDREWQTNVFFASSAELVRILKCVGEDPNAQFSPWIEVRLDYHRVQMAFPPSLLSASNIPPE